MTPTRRSSPLLVATCHPRFLPQKPTASTEYFVGRTSKGRAANEFDVIAVDELDTMNLEVDLTDAIVSADTASKKCSRAFSGLLCDDGSTSDISEAGGCVNDEEDFTDDTSIIGLIDNAFEFANKNATRSTCPLQLPWGKGCRTMGSSIPSRKGALNDRGSRRRHETVAHFESGDRGSRLVLTSVIRCWES